MGGMLPAYAVVYTPRLPHRNSEGMKPLEKHYDHSVLSSVQDFCLATVSFIILFMLLVSIDVLVGQMSVFSSILLKRLVWSAGIGSR